MNSILKNTYRSVVRRPLIFAVLALLLLTACASEDPSTPEAAEDESSEEAPTEEEESAPDEDAEAEDAEASDELAVVNYGTSGPPGAMGLLTTMITDLGIDEDNGIQLETSQFAPDQAESALLTGQVDVGFFALLSAVNTRAEGQDIVFMRGLQANHGGLLVKADSPYESLEDLKGEKVATLNPVSGIYTSMQVLAAELGLDWEEDFELLSAPPPGLVTLIETDEVEAILHFEPTVSRMTQSGDYRAIVIPNDVWREQTGGPLFMLGLATRQAWLDENPDLAARVVASFDEVLQRIEEDPSIIADYNDEWLELEDEVLDQYIERISGMIVAESNDEIRENVTMILTRAEELGAIEEAPPIEELFTSP